MTSFFSGYALYFCLSHVLGITSLKTFQVLLVATVHSVQKKKTVSYQLDNAGAGIRSVQRKERGSRSGIILFHLKNIY